MSECPFIQPAITTPQIASVAHLDMKQLNRAIKHIRTACGLDERAGALSVANSQAHQPNSQRILSHTIVCAVSSMHHTRISVVTCQCVHISV